ncbi:DUF4102 domain-containing protein [Escherichia coli]|nr:DUF4102 domain-containing protein [Escherichia coli]ELY7793026.1 DUF4102 domain-containing protein [Shigella sonnei]EED0792695.1 DUF4102 domain-containing protein [Escherichia coli]EED1465013.1 DUF4102 domain-containing protein [Escherichia coli]EEQ6982959.1 DUF4102 domain-containing protein [Escherichia coli]
MALTDAKIRAAKPTDKAYKLTDGAGMFLLVHPNGSRYWRLRYRILGKEKTLALGVYPEVSLSEARTKRDECHERCNSDPHPTPEIRSRG